MPAIPIPPSNLPPPKQILYPNVVINVNPADDGHVAMIIAAPGETLVFPMGVEYARELGRKLSAPHVIPASNGHGPHR